MMFGMDEDCMLEMRHQYLLRRGPIEMTVESIQEAFKKGRPERPELPEKMVGTCIDAGEGQEMTAQAICKIIDRVNLLIDYLKGVRNETAESN